MAQRMHFRVPHRAHGDHRHVERIEGRVALDEDESQRSTGEDRNQSAANQDQPVAKAAHAVAILPAAVRLTACGLTLPSYRQSIPASESTAGPLPLRSR